jgi:hypothetical protein
MPDVRTACRPHDPDWTDLGSVLADLKVQLTIWRYLRAGDGAARTNSTLETEGWVVTN